jgi:hypothetical protein
MADSPRHSSVTDTACTCGYLERAANDPDLPIAFDACLREYHFWYQVPGDEMPSFLVIYHCPFCGGAAPKSLRASLFHVVPEAERARLLKRFEMIRTLRDAEEQLGKPDEDNPHGSTSRYPEEGSCPPRDEIHRTYLYRSLSEVAEVVFTEHADGNVSTTFSGKQRK